MRKVRSAKKIAENLKKARKEKKIPLEVVVEELKELNVKCSLANLAKIESFQISCRSDILAALCAVYELNPNLILFED